MMRHRLDGRPSFPLATPRLRVAPSILSADFNCLEREIGLVEKAGAEMIHLDVMDGHFVPNISFGVPVIASLRERSTLYFDAHLMIEQPGRYAEAFVQAGCQLITFHIETTDHPVDLVNHIHSLGACAGVSLNPATPLEAVEEIIERVDLVLVMSVWPGFGGQAFLRDVLPKVLQLRKRLAPRQRLQIDGGVNEDTIIHAAQAGADTFVAGSAIFGAPDPAAAFSQLLHLAREALKAPEEG